MSCLYCSAIVPCEVAWSSRRATSARVPTTDRRLTKPSPTGGPTWLALGEARREGICEEAMKLPIEIQLVKVQPGQSRSGQAGSECCHAVGRPAGAKRTQRESRPRGLNPEIFIVASADVLPLDGRQHPDERHASLSDSPGAKAGACFQRDFP